MSFICSRSVLKKKYWGTEINEKLLLSLLACNSLNSQGAAELGTVCGVESTSYEGKKLIVREEKKHLLFHLPFTSVYTFYVSKTEKILPSKNTLNQGKT